MSRAHVLVLEHHRDLREALVEALLYEGYLVTPAATAGAALEVLRGAADSQVPDAVVVDAQDGRDVLAELRAAQRYARVAVVTLRFSFEPPSTGDVELQRPFRLEQLLSAVAAALQRHGPGLEDAAGHPRP